MGAQAATTAPWLVWSKGDEAKCEHCGRYGSLGHCVGCGALNRLIDRIEITTHQDNDRKFIEVFR